MDIRHLRSFVAIARAGSFTRASIKMGVDQPAISKQIHRLEAELNLSLFRRHGRGIALTEAGQVLLGYAQVILENLEKAHNALDAMRTEELGTLVLAMPSATRRILRTDFLSRFRQLFPKVQLEIMMGTSTLIQEWLLNHQIDIGVINGAAVSGDIDIIPLAHHNLRVISPKNTRLVQPGAQFPFKQLGSLPLILPQQPQPIRTLIEAEASRLDVKLNVVLQIVGPEFILELVKQGHGYTILPAYSLTERHCSSDFQQNEIVQPSIRRTLNVAIRSDRPRTRVIAEVVRLLQQHVDLQLPEQESDDRDGAFASISPARKIR